MEDGSVREDMKEGRKKKEAQRRRYIGDSKEADKKRDVRERGEEVGAVKRKEGDCAGGDGQGKGGE